MVEAEIPTMLSPDSAYRRHLKRLNDLISDGGSLSGHERNCAFLNIAGGRFATVSSVSGLDFADDARTPASVDWDRDGDLDLWVGNRTAPQLRFLRNDASSGNHFVALRLRGTMTNRDGIGARVEVWPAAKDAAGAAPLIKTLKAGDGYLGQSSKWLHFGLGRDPKIGKIVVRWPGGEPEEFAGVTADGWFLLEEGKGRARAVDLSPIALGEKPGGAPISSGPDVSRIVAATRTALPPLQFESFEGDRLEIPLADGRPILINLWASWCTPCLEELAEWKANAAQLEAAGVRVFAIAADPIDGNDASTVATARETAAKLGLPFAAGVATQKVHTSLQQAHDWPFRRRIPMPVPTSFLIDGQGRLTVIYRGTVSARQIIADCRLFGHSDSELLAASLPFPGKWLFEPRAPAPMPRGIELMEDGDVLDAAEYALRNLELLKPHREFPLLAVWISEKLLAIGETGRGLQFLKWAAEGDGANLTVVNNLAWQLAANPSDRVRDPELALQWAQKANAMTGGKHPAILDTVAVAHAAAGDFKTATKVLMLGIDLASAAGEEDLAASMRERQQLFSLGKPYLDPLSEPRDGGSGN